MPPAPKEETLNGAGGIFFIRTPVRKKPASITR